MACTGTHDALHVLVKPCSPESCVLSCLLQVFVASYSTEADAAWAHDMASLAFFGANAAAKLNVSCTAAILHLLL
jgi:hypothetical protein